MSEDIFLGSQLSGEKVLLASSGWKPGVLLNIPNHKRVPSFHLYPPHRKNDLVQNVHSAEVDEP